VIVDSLTEEDIVRFRYLKSEFDPVVSAAQKSEFHSVIKITTFDGASTKHLNITAEMIIEIYKILAKEVNE